MRKKNNMVCDPQNLILDLYDLIDDLTFAELSYCKRFLITMYSKSVELGEAVRANHASVIYSNNGDPESWEEAMNVARAGGTLKISCNRPSHWGMREVTGGEYLDFYSLKSGGFVNYKGPMTKYTTQLRFDGSDSVRTAIINGTIVPGDIVGTKRHTFAILKVDRSTGSAVVFDGGHKFTNHCKKENRFSPIIDYSPDITDGYKVYQIIRWIK